MKIFIDRLYEYDIQCMLLYENAILKCIQYIYAHRIQPVKSNV